MHVITTEFLTLGASRSFVPVIVIALLLFHHWQLLNAFFIWQRLVCFSFCGRINFAIFGALSFPPTYLFKAAGWLKFVLS